MYDTVPKRQSVSHHRFHSRLLGLFVPLAKKETLDEEARQCLGNRNKTGQRVVLNVILVGPGAGGSSRKLVFQKR